MRIKLDIPLTVYEITNVISGIFKGNDKKIEYITTDTRELKPGDLFFALNGKKFSGTDFVAEAESKGAISASSISSSTNGIYVENTNSALLKLASYYKSKLPHLKHTIAITGSVGKTTTKEYLSTLVSTKFTTHKSDGNFNNNVGLPLTVLSAPRQTEVMILEMGMNHIGEISELSKCAEADLGIITNVGTAHIGNLGSREKIAEAKLEILDGLKGKLIVPFDEPLLRISNTLTFSTRSPDATVFLKHIGNKSDGYLFELHYNGVYSKHNLTLPAYHLAECLAPAYLAAEELNIKFMESAQAFSNISRQNIRQNIIPIDDFYILSDFYNASLESFISGFEYVTSLREYASKSALIGDVLELGVMSESIHREIGKRAASYGFENLYLFGKYALSVLEGAVEAGFSTEKIHINTDLNNPYITAKEIIDNHTPREIILFKASHRVGLDRIVSLLKKA